MRNLSYIHKQNHWQSESETYTYMSK